MTSKPTVLTVILNWRTPEMTLRSVAAAELAMQGIDGAISVVDNASGDGSFEHLSDVLRGHDRVRVVQAGRNGGFGAGNNVAIRLGLPDGTRPTFCYILNSDAFPASDAIARLVDYMASHPRAGLCGSAIHGPDGEMHVTCFRFPSIASEFEGAVRTGPISRLLANRIVPLPVPETSCKVEWIAGASLMIRDEVIQTVGLFDERFFLYFEETDLCHRAGEAGWETHFVHDSAVEHIGSVSTGMKKWGRVPGYWFDSRWRYFCKRGGRTLALAATLACLAGGALHRVRRLVQPRLAPGPDHYLRDMASHALRHMHKDIAAPDQTLSSGLSSPKAA